MADWEARTDWFTPKLTADQVATFLGVAPNTISQMLARGSFPQPRERAGRRYVWAPAAVYRYGLQHRPQLTGRVPRLFPRVPDPTAAVFAGSSTIVLPGTGPRFVVYRWIPGDNGGGSVSLAYPVGGAEYRDGTSRQLHALFEALNAIGGAVAVTDIAEKDGYPSLWVVDGRDPAAMIERHDNDNGAVLYNWHTLSCLLRVDIPWWAPELRDEQAMRAWRPGSLPAYVRPRMGQRDPAALTDIVTADTPIEVRQALEQRAAFVEFDLASVPKYVETPGFIYGGHHNIDLTSGYPPPRWSWQQCAAVLHHHINSPSAAAAALVNMLPGPAATYTFTVRADESHPLARQWLDRLEPADGPIELGDHLVARHASRIPIHHFARDPYNEDCWVAVDTARTVHATVGTRVPAKGALHRVVLLESGAAFFLAVGADGESAAWPVPHPDSGAFNSGFPGNGPTDFARAVTRLAASVSADVHDGAEHDRSGRLWSAISSQEPPLDLGTEILPQGLL